MAPIAAGVLNEIEVLVSRGLGLHEPYHVRVDRGAMIAVDGEREIRLGRGDAVDFSITRDGPLRVLVRKTLDEAVSNNRFELR